MLDVSGQPEKNNQLIIWKKHGRKNQKWRIVQHNGRYHIISSMNNEMLSSSNNSGNSG